MADHIRWRDTSRMVPRGLLAHAPTETNPAGIYVPPGDPLSGVKPTPRPWWYLLFLAAALPFRRVK